ncbi:MAG: hypothetical protein AAGF11_34615 [Myxococcota bacterium]
MKVFLALEGPSDLRRVRWLLDRWLADNVDWFVPEYPDSCRELIGVDPGQKFLKIKSIPERRKELVRGGFGGPHPRGEAGTLHDLRIILRKLNLEPDVVLWLRDSDGDDRRAEDAHEWVERTGESKRFILGYAQQVSEAWVLVGWVAKSAQDDRALAQVSATITRKLPRDAHLLTHKDEVGGAKWALCQLVSDDWDRERQALLRAWTLDDSELEACGLAAFRRVLTHHVGLRRALGLPTHPTVHSS